MGQWVIWVSDDDPVATLIHDHEFEDLAISPQGGVAHIYTVFFFWDHIRSIRMPVITRRTWKFKMIIICNTRRLGLIKINF